VLVGEAGIPPPLPHATGANNSVEREITCVNVKPNVPCVVYLRFWGMVAIIRAAQSAPHGAPPASASSSTRAAHNIQHGVAVALVLRIAMHMYRNCLFGRVS